MSNPENSSALSAHPIVSKMIKGISASAPPKTIRAIWNVSDLCSWISNNLPSHLSYFEVARHLALLLLLLSGRRVHDLTLLRMDPPIYNAPRKASFSGLFLDQSQIHLPSSNLVGNFPL